MGLCDILGYVTYGACDINRLCDIYGISDIHMCTGCVTHIDT